MGRHATLVGIMITSLASTLGCETLIDLGPKAKLENSAGAAAIDDCGFTTNPASAACSSCIRSRCCDEHRACSEDPTCTTQRMQMSQCAYEVACIEGVIADAGADSNLTIFTTCATACTTACLPTGGCLQLAQCCQTLDSLTRTGCIETVETDDQDRCTEALGTFDCP